METAKESCACLSNGAVTTSSLSAEANPAERPKESGLDPFEGLDDLTKESFEVCVKISTEIDVCSSLAKKKCSFGRD